MPDWSYHPFFRPLLFRLPPLRTANLWTWLLGGIVAFIPTFYNHLAVGYHNAFHLAPLWAGIVFWILGLALSYPLLFRKNNMVGTRNNAQS